MRKKQEYLNALVEDFRSRWERLSKLLKRKIDGVPFREVIDLTESILKSELKNLQYVHLLYEGDIHRAFHDYSLFIDNETDNPVRDYVSLFDNLSFSFGDDGECNLVKLTVKADAREFEEYLISTEHLFAMGKEEFNRHIMSRVGHGFTNVRPPEYRRMSMGKYVELLRIIDDEEDYESKNPYILKEQKMKALYESLPEDGLGQFGFDRAPVA